MLVISLGYHSGFYGSLHPSPNATALASSLSYVYSLQVLVTSSPQSFRLHLYHLSHPFAYSNASGYHDTNAEKPPCVSIISRSRSTRACLSQMSSARHHYYKIQHLEQERFTLFIMCGWRHSVPMSFILLSSHSSLKAMAESRKYKQVQMLLDLQWITSNSPIKVEYTINGMTLIPLDYRTSQFNSPTLNVLRTHILA